MKTEEQVKEKLFLLYRRNRKNPDAHWCIQIDILEWLLDDKSLVE